MICTNIQRMHTHPMQSHAGHFAAFGPEKEDLEAGRYAEAGKLHPSCMPTREAFKRTLPQPL